MVKLVMGGKWGEKRLFELGKNWRQWQTAKTYFLFRGSQ